MFSLTSNIIKLACKKQFVNCALQTYFKMSQTTKDIKLNHLFEESAALNVYDNSVLNLAAGCPGPDLLETLPGIMEKATAHRMKEERANNYYLFQYGPTAGLWPARDALAGFLSKNYGDEVKRENIVLTCGATHGLHIVVSTLLAPNGVIFVEEYTYMIALQLFKEFPAHKIVTIPMDSNGVDTIKLREIIAQTKTENAIDVSDTKPFWSMFYTIPNFHNPTGTLLTPDRCREVANIAKEMNMLVFCDDVYNLLYYGDQTFPPPRLFSHSRDEGNVISNGSFSKILAPGLRIGWMELPTRLVKRLRESGIMQSGGSVNNVMFGLLQSIIELGLADKQLVWYKQVYKDRMTSLCDTLKDNMPKGCSFHRAEGGYFIWLQVPIDGASFLAWCMAQGGPGAVPAARFTVLSASPFEKPSQKQFSPAIRISIGFHNSETIKKAAKQLCDLLKKYIEENNV